MSSDTLWRLLPTMDQSITGLGLDFIWAKVLAGDPFSMAVIDEVQVRHTRPLGGGALYQVAEALGVSPWDEYRNVLKKFGITRRRYWISRAVRRSGREINDGLWLRCLFGWGLLMAAPQLKPGWAAVPRFWLSGMWHQVKDGPRD